MSRFTDKLSSRGGKFIIKLLPFGLLLVVVVFNMSLVDLSTFGNKQQEQFPATTTASLLQERAHQHHYHHPLYNPRILMAIVSYDLKQYQHLDRLLDSIFHDICASASVVDVVIYTTVAWPVSSFEDWEGCGTIEIKIKASSWKKRLVNFHRELFYQKLKLNRYDLFVYTEDDHLIQMRHIFGFLRETQMLRETLGEDRFTDYSIGFLRYEEEEEDSSSSQQQQLSAAKKIIWEHRWDLSSSSSSSVEEGFDNRHLVHISGMNNTNQTTTYFNGGGPYHQGMFMATPQQLLAWKERPPNCRFNTTWFVERPERREKVSSLHLFSKEGCNVTQIIPMERYQDFLVHHMSNTQHKVLYKYLPKDGSVNPTSITSTQLGSRLRRRSTAAVAKIRNKTNVRMYNDETQKKGDPEPDLSEYQKYDGERTPIAVARMH
jgi:hypothetical protein